MQLRNLSLVAVLAAVLGLLGVVVAGAIFLGTDDAHSQRFAQLLALVALALPVVLAQLRAEQSANALNGELDRRVTNAVLRANLARRASDVTPDSASPTGTQTAENPATLGVPEGP